MLSTSTLEFTTLSNVESMLSILALIGTALGKVEAPYSHLKNNKKETPSQKQK